MKGTNQDDGSARPVTYIDWFNAARFANWMSNGQSRDVKRIDL
jgi:formylglycine-generating enzyme required for sulfatase activity